MIYQASATGGYRNNLHGQIFAPAISAFTSSMWLTYLRVLRNQQLVALASNTLNRYKLLNQPMCDMPCFPVISHTFNLLSLTQQYKPLITLLFIFKELSCIVNALQKPYISAEFKTANI